MSGLLGKKSEALAWFEDYAKGNSEPPEELAQVLNDWALAQTYHLLPSEVDRLTLYDIWCSNIGPLWEQAQNKVKK